MDRFVSAFWDRAVRSTSSGSASNSSRANRFVPRRTALVPVLLLVGVSGGTGGRLADDALALGDTPPTVTIVAPSGGEQYVGGSRQDIEYTVFDPDLQPLTVTIDHSTNDGVSWQQILSTTNANGSFSVGWDVPNATYANGRVRVTANDGATAPVSVVSSAFSVTSSETGSNTLTIGTNSGAVGNAAALSVSLANEDVVRSLEMDVVFDPEILSLTGVSRLGRAVAFSDSSAVVADGTVRIFLQPSGLQTIAAGSGSILSLSFQLEAAGSSDVSTAAFVLSGLAGNALEATSVPGRMNVTGGSGDPPVITLVSPQGGETFVGGSVATIQYVASGGEEPLSVAIEYSGNDGASYSESGVDPNNVGVFLWQVPNAQTAAGRIRVTASDGANSATDESGSFTITAATNRNVLAVGSAGGVGGTSVSLPLTLENADVVKALQFDLDFEPDVTAFASATASGRGASMVLTMQTVAAGRARGVMRFEDASTLGAGDGEVATIQFSLLGSRGEQSLVEPTAILLSDVDANEIPDVVGLSGVVTVTSDPLGPPRVDLSVLKNPGRPRHLQIFVSVADGSGNAPSVSLGGTSVTMTSLGEGVFTGTAFVEQSTSSVTVTATDTVGDATGTDSETVSF